MRKRGQVIIKMVKAVSHHTDERRRFRMLILKAVLESKYMSEHAISFKAPKIPNYNMFISCKPFT